MLRSDCSCGRPTSAGNGGVRDDPIAPTTTPRRHCRQVWPTDLGVAPTAAALARSRRALRLAWVDVHSLHWPLCDATVAWMRCDDAARVPAGSAGDGGGTAGEESLGTWQQSWRALERAYAEGTVLQLGVSNFDAARFQELLALAVVPPALLQNFVDVAHAADPAVLALCARHGVLFQAYAATRNLPVSTVDGVAARDDQALDLFQ